jgi:hypothetical protein
MAEIRVEEVLRIRIILTQLRLRRLRFLPYCTASQLFEKEQQLTLVNLSPTTYSSDF